MNTKMYEKMAKLIKASPDPGGEMVKLLETVDESDPKMILITQAVPIDGKANPVVHIAVFTNKQTDFPADTQEEFNQWIIDCANELRANST